MTPLARLMARVCRVLVLHRGPTPPPVWIALWGCGAQSKQERREYERYVAAVVRLWRRRKRKARR